MGRVSAIFAGCFPRLDAPLIWSVRPALFGDAFRGSWPLPVLAFLLRPVTTLMDVLLSAPVAAAATT